MMKRFHVHLSVTDLAPNIRFYSKLFDAQPSVVKDDYAKWMLDDPRVNFAISTREGRNGLNHLGLQVDSGEALSAIRAQAAAADIAAVEEKGAACCYSNSDKYWIEDPQGIAWEAFHTLGSIPVFGKEPELQASNACCAPPAAESKSPCCAPSVAVAVPAPVQKKSGCCG